jgi:2-oxoglutarate dehydrogenase E1 component
VDYAKSKEATFEMESWHSDVWEELKKPEKYGRVKDTGIDIDILKDLGDKISKVPDDFKLHKNIKNIMDARRASYDTGKNIDWGSAENLAFASLVSENYHVRISGQDVARGTFSHRHAHLHHQEKDATYIPINQVDPLSSIRYFIASNSHLSEMAVLGYEYGYACANPNTLTIWEA